MTAKASPSDLVDSEEGWQWIAFENSLQKRKKIETDHERWERVKA